MSPSASETAYETIKQALKAGRIAFGPLDIGRLGDRLRVSATPVREALARLAAERLILFVPHEGYSFAPPGPELLKDLYALNGELVLLALAGLPPVESRPSGPGVSAGGRTPDILHATLGAIASAQPNRELEDQIARTNDRLCLARSHEEPLFPHGSAQAVRIARLWEKRRVDMLQTAWGHYFRRRMQRAPEIARLMANRGPA